MSTHAYWILAGLGCSIICGWCRADDSAFGHALGQPDLLDEQLTSVAAGHAQPIQRAPGMVSVITASQIARSGARDLYDILRTVPGFFVGENIAGVEPILSVRGFKSSYNQNVLILLDGVPQTDYVAGDRLAVLGKIPLDLIERIDIMRGPGSALHGADAYSAVIDIITRATPPDRTQITLTGGSQRTRIARALGGSRRGGSTWVGAVEYQRTDGHRPYIGADAQTALDATFGTDASLAPGHANTQLGLIGAQANVTNDRSAFMLRASHGRDIGMKVGLSGALDPFGRVDITTLEGRYTWRARARDWSTKVLFDQSFYQLEIEDAHYLPPRALPVFPDGLISSSQTRQTRARLQGAWEHTGFPSHYLTLGAGAEYGTTHVQSERRNFSLVRGFPRPLGTVQDITDPALLAFGARDFSHDLQYLYIQDEWRFAADWTLTWGLRYDHYADYGDQLNPRAALVWEASPYLSAKLLYGQGFRGPSLVDTNARQSPGFVGTPGLKPERIDSLELALDYQARDDLLVRLNVFDQKTDDQIQIFTELTPARPLNTAQQRGRGVELEAWWDLSPHTQWYAAYSYQDSVDKTTDSDVGYHPHHLVHTYLQHRQKPWLFSLHARHVGPRDRRVGDARGEADTYTIIDGLIRYDVAPGVELGLDVRNVLDERAQDVGPGLSQAFPSDLPLPGRTYYFTLISRF